jgi:hypothetical protein
LDEGGDIWRVRREGAGIQASGIVDGTYERIIPFRQREFKNAFLEWVILDNVKHRKAASKRLKRVFKIANIQAASSIPHHSSIANWIHELFEHFEPDIINEIANARSKISITFDGWGSKHEKISVIGVVIHFINEYYENVTRLIGLPELPGHRKAGVGMLLYFVISIIFLTIHRSLCFAVVLMIYKSGIAPFGRSRAILANGRAPAGP